jgi:hypothetical protein
MNQMDLFDTQTSEKDAAAPDAIPVRSGCVGPIRFGSTEGSFTLTKEILIDLSTPSADTAETSS